MGALWETSMTEIQSWNDSPEAPDILFWNLHHIFTVKYCCLTHFTSYV